MRRADVIEWFEEASSFWKDSSTTTRETYSDCVCYSQGTLIAAIAETKLYFEETITGFCVSYTLDSLWLDKQGDLTNGLKSLHLPKAPNITWI